MNRDVYVRHLEYLLTILKSDSGEKTVPMAVAHTMFILGQCPTDDSMKDDLHDVLKLLGIDNILPVEWEILDD